MSVVVVAAAAAAIPIVFVGRWIFSKTALQLKSFPCVKSDVITSSLKKR